MSTWVANLYLVPVLTPSYLAGSHDSQDYYPNDIRISNHSTTCCLQPKSGSSQPNLRHDSRTTRQGTVGIQKTTGVQGLEHHEDQSKARACPRPCQSFCYPIAVWFLIKAGGKKGLSKGKEWLSRLDTRVSVLL